MRLKYRIVKDKTKNQSMDEVFQLCDFNIDTIYPVLMAYIRLYKRTKKDRYKRRIDEINLILAEKEES